MIIIRPSSERGLSQLAWLTSRHTFSFDQYYDPRYMHFSSLRVINQDIVAAGKGFGMHPHQDMEIITFMLRGEIAHQDSMGNKTTIKPGEIQRMTAGTGITHSEFNASNKEELELLQIWIVPEQKNLTPSYEQITFDKNKEWQLLGSKNRQNNSVTIHQDINLYLGQYTKKQNVNYPIAANRYVWIQMISGKLTVNQHLIAAGDGVAIKGEPSLDLDIDNAAKFLLFDLG